jgi:hypothetical protein
MKINIRIKSLVFFALATILTTGCAKKLMPEGSYKLRAFHAAEVAKCFRAEYITPEVYANDRLAAVWFLSVYDYDSNKLDKLYQARVTQFRPSQSLCRQPEADANSSIRIHQQIQAKQTQNTQWLVDYWLY